MVLLSYISLGSFIASKLLDIPFLSALYFSVASLESIGNTYSFDQLETPPDFLLKGLATSIPFRQVLKSLRAFTLRAE